MTRHVYNIIRSWVRVQRFRVISMILVRSVLDEHMGIEVLGVGGIPFVIVVKS